MRVRMLFAAGVVILTMMAAMGCGPAGPQSSDRGSGLRSKPFATAGPVPELNTAALIGNTMGWVGGDGVILSTTDGGEHWRRQYSGPADVQQLDFLNRSDGWARTKTILLRTTNGGAAWITETRAGDFSSIQFVTPETGFALNAAGQLEKTADGGGMWRPVPLPVSASTVASAVAAYCADSTDAIGCGTPRTSGPVASFCFASPSVGFWVTVRALSSALYQTTDGGSTWQKVPSPEPVAEHPISEPATSGIDQQLECTGTSVFDFVAEGVGLGSESYGLFSTSVSRIRWVTDVDHLFPSNALEGPPEVLSTSFVVHGNRGYLIGNCSACSDARRVLVRAGEGAEQTVAVQGLGSAVLHQMVFISPTVGWAVGQQGGGSTAAGGLWQTVNGGALWTLASFG